MKPAEDNLYYLADIRLWLLHLLAEEAGRIMKGTRPGDDEATQDWELENWGREADFWENKFPRLVAQVQGIIGSKPLIEVMTPFMRGIELDIRVYKRLKGEDFPFKGPVDPVPIFESTRVRINMHRYEPYLSGPGYYDDPKDFPGNKYTLVDRGRYFYLLAYKELLGPRGGMVLLSPAQVKDLQIADELGPNQIYVTRFGF